MRWSNTLLFYILVIVVAMVFCIRPVYADGSAFPPPAGFKVNYWAGLTAQSATQQTVCATFATDIWQPYFASTLLMETATGASMSCDIYYLKYSNGSHLHSYSSIVNSADCPTNSTGTSSCLCNAGYEPNASLTACVPANNCVSPGAWAGQAVVVDGYGSRPTCAPDLCYYNVTTSITSGEAAEPPNPRTTSWLDDVTGNTCTGATANGASGGCPDGQVDLGLGCMTYADNQAAFNAVNHLGAYVDPCVAAGTCTSLIDPCIGAGTCVGTGTGVGGTAGSGGTGVGGSTYVDPCIAAGTCTAAADPCIAAGTCTGSGTGTGGTAGGVNPCIAAGTCAGSGTGTGSGTGSATESTLRSVLDTLAGFGDFGSVADADLGTKSVYVSITPVLVGSNGSCPEPSPMVLHGQTYYFEWTTYCNFASGIKPIMLVFAWLSAAGILIGGFKSA